MSSSPSSHAPGATLARRWALRDATAHAHRRLDRGMNTFDLTQPDGYRGFLRVMGPSIAAIERGIEASGVPGLLPDWAERTRTKALRHDLAGHAASMAPAPRLHLANDAEAFGAAYVLEGSRLGSQILLRQAMRSAHADVTANTRFLRHGAVATMWPTFLDALDRHLRNDHMVADAIVGALKAFALCQTVLDGHLFLADPTRDAHGGTHHESASS